MTAIEQLITEYMDVWTSAVKVKSSSGRGGGKKLELHGVKKLRELILELAVRGLLVPHVRDEGPASNLIEGVRKNLKENGIKPKGVPEISDDEIPFSLPDSWEWARLGTLAELITKGSSPEWQGIMYTENPSDVLFVTSENVGHMQVLLESPKYVEKKFNEISPRSILKKNDLLMNIVGASIGRSAIFNDNRIANINQAVCLIRPAENGCLPDYLLKFFNSNTCISYMYDKQVDNARANLSMTSVSRFLVPIPPLAEQHRIVAKVNELMALCDQLERGQEGSLRTHQTLVQTLLKTLTTASDHAQFTAAWKRIEANFDILFTTESSIDELKQAILQLAVMGKLVPQGAQDEPAEKLMERVSLEKERLESASNIRRKSKAVSVTVPTDPHSLPETWEWCCLRDIGITSTGKTPKTSVGEYFDGEIPFIGPGQITSDGQLLESDKTITELGLAESAEGVSGDILMVCIGGSIGKSLILDRRVAFNQQINSIRPVIILPEYLSIALCTERFYRSVLSESTGSATPIINRSKWENLLVPIPPIEEQRRIVNIVSSILEKLENIKTGLGDLRQAQAQIADSLSRTVAS